ncbi:hypothetical protein [Lacibacter sediminis]|uniref:SH3 domain-containing protein n=1 Tax=Lacibacter sediminis TaxID=2760713 RepID=A0A7G5XJH5_9BACT|nr:hypothetical protein [Lacibacter sediminis]QNA45628.1 hypothetical protein H4075_05350 [Lacibacter sediminis]
MKHLVIIVIPLLFQQQLFSQQDYSGVYGEKIPLSKEMREVYKELSPDKDDFGYDAKLILKKVSGNKYKFWLYVCKGFPSYNSGQIDGFIEFNSMKSKFRLVDDIVGSCKLDFSVNGKTILIDHDYENGYCGFGANVTAQGVYPLKRKQVRTEDIEETFQYDVEEVTIAKAKAYIYKNQNDMNPSMQYFVKGDRILLLKDEINRVYTEFISASGKFVFGWVNKTDLKN